MPAKPKKAQIKPEEDISLDAVLELTQDKKRLLWINFKAGFMRGFAGVIGAAIAILIIGYLVTSLGGLPIIGDVVKDIGEAARPN